MNFFVGLGYAILNGFLYVVDLLANNWWWAFGLAALIAIFVFECKETNEKIVDDDRQIM
jgi:hypothetical protein